MFQRLIPYSVHESASLYSGEKAKIVGVKQRDVIWPTLSWKRLENKS
jgi:hypothetical protein